LFLSLALVQPFGIEGVAWGTTIPNIVGNLIVAIHVCKLLRVSLADYLQQSFAKPLMAVCLLAVAWWAAATWIPMNDWPSLVMVAGIGLVVYSFLASLGVLV